MDVNNKKKIAAEAAIDYIQIGDVVGVGTGSTADYFISALANIKNKIDGAVASSEASARQLQSHGIRILDLNATGPLPVYIDGADEATTQKSLVKGGGGALTREKIVASASSQFICIADDSKLVEILGKFPLPVEVIPMARSVVARQLVKLGGVPELREGFTTDNGNIILDVYNLDISQPLKMESDISLMPGVVTAGIFAHRPADVILLGCDNGIKKI